MSVALQGCRIEQVLWEVLGHYQFELQRSAGGWKIHKLTLQLLLQTGNTKLLAEAAKPPR